MVHDTKTKRPQTSISGEAFANSSQVIGTKACYIVIKGDNDITYSTGHAKIPAASPPVNLTTDHGNTGKLGTDEWLDRIRARVVNHYNVEQRIRDACKTL